MDLPTHIDYPIVAIADLHGQRRFLERLLARLESLPEWSQCTLVFLGDYCDRGPDVKGTIDLILGLFDTHGKCAAVMGNHDLATVRGAELDGRPRSPYWFPHYRDRYDYTRTFESYIGREPRAATWEADIAELRRQMPARHRAFLSALPWVVEAPRHLFLHAGLSPELDASARDQLRALHARQWSRALSPVAGTLTDTKWQDEYPVWLGADKGLSANPLPYAGKTQVTGHVAVPQPDANDVRIRLDTTGGLSEPLTACFLRSADALPVFIRSDGR